jgi:hypothetical protein
MSANGAKIKAATAAGGGLDMGVPGFKAEKLRTRAGVAPSRMALDGATRRVSQGTDRRQ